MNADGVLATHRQVGNFPQAFSHLALIGTALNLHDIGPAQRRGPGKLTSAVVGQLTDFEDDRSSASEIGRGWPVTGVLTK